MNLVANEDGGCQQNASVIALLVSFCNTMPALLYIWKQASLKLDKVAKSQNANLSLFNVQFFSNLLLKPFLTSIVELAILLFVYVFFRQTNIDTEKQNKTQLKISVTVPRSNQPTVAFFHCEDSIENCNFLKFQQLLYSKQSGLN